MRILVLVAALLISPLFVAAQGQCNLDLGDGNNGFRNNPLQQGDVIYVTGGTQATPFDGVTIHLLQNDGRDFSSSFSLDQQKDALGAPNPVTSSAIGGAIYDEIIGFCNEKKEGEYDIVIDNNQNGVFEPSTDCYQGSGSSYFLKIVNNGPIPPWKQQRIQDIKDQARQDSLSYQKGRMAFRAKMAWAKAKTYYDMTVQLMAGNWFGFAMNLAGEAGIKSYNDQVISIGEKYAGSYLDNQIAKNDAIYRDPPDTSYKLISPLSSRSLLGADRDSARAKMAVQHANAVKIKNRALEGFLKSMEKYQGALNDQQNTYLRLQARAMSKYITLWHQADELEQEALDFKEGHFTANYNDTIIPNTKVQSVIDRIDSAGFNSQEKAEFELYGISQAQQDSIKTEVLATDTSQLPEGYFADFIDSAKADRQQTSQLLDSVLTDVQATTDTITTNSVNENDEGLLDYHPHATINGDSVIPVGTTGQLEAQDTNANVAISSWEWDLDGDSLYDDATGSSVPFTPLRDGHHLVGVKATNVRGNVDYAYGIIEAPVSNAAPVINNKTPDTLLVRATDTSQVTFSINASDPEGGSLSYQWLKDDTLVGTGNSYNFNPSSSQPQEAFNLRVIVSDGDTLNNDNGAFWRVVKDVGPAVYLGADTTICTTDSLTLDAGPDGDTYTWQDSSSSRYFTATTAGTYKVTVTDNNGISNMDSITVTTDTPPSVSLRNDTSICAGSSLTLDAGGSSGSYQWQDGSSGPQYQVDSAGLYYVTLTKTNGCGGTTSDSIDVDIDQLPNVSLGPDTMICPGTCLTLDAGNPSAYHFWNDFYSGQSRCASTAGQYAVRVVDSNNCKASDTMQLTQAPPISVDDSVTDATCDSSDGEITLTITGGAGSPSLNWSPSSLPPQPVQSNLAAGNYSVTMTDTLGCQESDTFAVNDIGAPSLTASVTDVSCHGGSDGSINLQVNGGTSPFSYSWNNGKDTTYLDSLGAGNYSVTVSDSNNCQATTSTAVQEPQPLNVSADIQPATCDSANGDIDLTVSGGTSPYAYSWSPNPPDNLPSGNYMVTITDNNGCQNTQTYTVPAEEGPDLSVAVNDESCPGAGDGEIELTITKGTQPFDTLWSGGLTSTQNLSAGTYQVTVSDSNNCEASKTATVDAPSPLAVNLGQDTTICNNESITLHPGVSGASYLWQDGSTNQQLTINSQGQYWVEVTDTNNCAYRDTVQVMVDTCTGMAASPKQSISIYPNPAHDQIMIDVQRSVPSSSQLTIFNFKGQVVRKMSIATGNKTTYTKQLEVGDLSPGVYFTRLTSAYFTYRKKLIIK